MKIKGVSHRNRGFPQFGCSRNRFQNESSGVFFLCLWHFFVRISSQTCPPRPWNPSQRWQQLSLPFPLFFWIVGFEFATLKFSCWISVFVFEFNAFLGFCFWGFHLNILDLFPMWGLSHCNFLFFAFLFWLIFVRIDWWLYSLNMRVGAETSFAVGIVRYC